VSQFEFYSRDFFVRPARSWLRRVCIHRLDNLLPRYERIANPRRHRRGNAKRLMDAQEIIPDGIDRNHVGVVLELFRERVRKPRKAAVGDAQSEI